MVLMGLAADDVPSMRIKEIKAELQRRGVGCEDCFEKADLVARLQLALRQPPMPTGTQLPMQRLKGQAGLMGPGVDTAEGNDYYAFTATFPQSPRAEMAVTLIIDTAATVSLLTRDAAEALGGRRTGVTASGTAAGGEAATAGYQVTLGPITLAGHPLPLDFRPVVADVPPITPDTKGILGLDVLSQFDVLFDFKGSTCTLYPKGSALNTPLVAGKQQIPYRVLPIGLLVADIRLHRGGAPGSGLVLGILDTGAASSVMNWRAAQTLGLGPDSPDLINTGLVMAGQDGRMMPMVEAVLQVSAGPLPPCPPLRVGIGDLPGFLSMGIADKPVLLLGADFWRASGTLLLTMANRAFWLPAPEAP